VTAVVGRLTNNIFRRQLKFLKQNFIADIVGQATNNGSK
jgi:hypothetical protein